MFKKYQCIVQVFLIFLLCEQLLCDVCVTEDFESPIDDILHFENNMCKNMLKWQQGDYSTIDVNGFHGQSQSYITPGESFSCSYLNVELAATGTLEVNVYIESKSPKDLMVVMAYEGEPGATDVKHVGEISISSEEAVSDWKTYAVELTGSTKYNGYIILLGLAAENTKILIDSLRYIPPTADSDSCQIYEDGQPCIEYNFEEKFYDTFDDYYKQCSGIEGTWSTINKNYNTYIQPQENIISCISSSAIPFAPSGSLELEIVNGIAKNNRITSIYVFIYEDINGVPGDLVSFGGSYLLAGENTLKISIERQESFNGFITLVGWPQDEDAPPLIDSFKYIPTSSQGNNCKSYLDVLLS